MNLNLLKIIPLFALFFSLSAFAAGQKTINEGYLHGDWHCKHEGEDKNTKMKVKVDYNVNFLAKGTSTGTGTLLFYMPNLPGLKYRIEDSSTWSIKNGYLTLTSKKITSVNVSHPELDQLLNLGDLIPKSISESSKILKLTKSRLKVQSKSGDGAYSCSKVISKS